MWHNPWPGKPLKIHDSELNCLLPKLFCCHRFRISRWIHCWWKRTEIWCLRKSVGLWLIWIYGVILQFRKMSVWLTMKNDYQWDLGDFESCLLMDTDVNILNPISPGDKLSVELTDQFTDHKIVMGCVIFVYGNFQSIFHHVYSPFNRQQIDACS